MLKRISCLTLCLVLLLGIFVQQVTAMEDSEVLESPAAAEPADSEQADAAEDESPAEEDPAEEDPAEEDEQTETAEGPYVLVDGVVVEDADPTVYGQTTYVSLRSVTMALRPDAVVTWEGDHASVTADGLTITIYPEMCYFVANGRYLYLPQGVCFENNNTMLPVRALAQALGAQVQWNPSDGNIYITSGTGAIVSGDEYYDSDSLYWLSRIISAESGNQPLAGKIGVGNVILNRVKSSLFPNTVYGVIFQKNQFTPASNGSIYRDPNAESVIAAKLCLDGAEVLSSALWFNRAGSSSWASRNKSYVATIGAHSFYA